VQLSKLFSSFLQSEKAAGLMLICCTLVSLALANSGLSSCYNHLWHSTVFNKSLEFWINDGLMTIFFLMVGLEIEREIYIGELAGMRRAMLPLMAAVGGMLLPALIHFIFNHGTETQNGFGIPMATDIAFSLGILSLLGKRVPLSLKVFLTALAIIDDLGAILVIAIFYSQEIAGMYLILAAILVATMLVMNRKKVHRVWIYLFLGTGLWFCLYKAGIHPSISGVLLAFVIPFGNGDEQSPSYALQENLHNVVAFVILPLFALANTAITISSSVLSNFISFNSLGIMAGLFFGKPIGIFLFSLMGMKTRVCQLPDDLNMKHIFGAGILAGIGFTMSVFITLLAFSDESIIGSSKIVILLASAAAGIAGYVFLRLVLPASAND
jgi:NhaA family Na+:H+ antiporter